MELIRKGPLVVQATDHSGISWTGPVVWEMVKVGTIELAEGTLAMVKQKFLKQRETANKKRYEHTAVKRQERHGGVTAWQRSRSGTSSGGGH